MSHICCIFHCYIQFENLEYCRVEMLNIYYIVVSLIQSFTIILNENKLYYWTSTTPVTENAKTEVLRVQICSVE